MTAVKKLIFNIKSNPLSAVIFIVPFLFGGFFEYISCILSIALAVWLIVLCKKGAFKISANISFFAVLCIPLFYLISALWAVDKGMAFIGFLKYLPLPLFALLIIQYEGEKREHCLRAIPYSAAVMTVISYALSFIPFFKGHLVVMGRLAGFFEYPNTFALFLLLGLIILSTERTNENKADSKNAKTDEISSEKAKARQRYNNIISIIIALILLFGIFQSGSRTIFILLVFFAIAVAVFSKNKIIRKLTLIIVPSVIVLAIAAAAITDNFSTIGRFLTSSLTESTFVGRILYYLDVIPQILTHPFGQGYGSYLYTQGSFQTGVYTVKYMHNDFLQLFFEIGWIPAVMFLAAIVYSFFKKGTSLGKRLVILAIVMHSMLDFSLQYIGIFLILLCVLDYGRIREIHLKNTVKKVICITGGGVAALCLYFGVACFFEYLGIYAVSTAMYPSYTEGLIVLMTEEEDLEAAKEYSDKVLELNKSVHQAYMIQSAYAFQNGDVAVAIQYKEKAISLNPYASKGYREYIDMLSIAYNMYIQAGDAASAEYCRKKITTVPTMLDKLKERTSSLAYMVDIIPNLELNEEYTQIVNGFKHSDK